MRGKLCYKAGGMSIKERDILTIESLPPLNGWLDNYLNAAKSVYEFYTSKNGRKAGHDENVNPMASLEELYFNLKPSDLLDFPNLGRIAASLPLSKTVALMLWLEGRHDPGAVFMSHNHPLIETAVWELSQELSDKQTRHKPVYIMDLPLAPQLSQRLESILMKLGNS
jgi:hypothetical protein